MGGISHARNGLGWNNVVYLCFFTACSIFLLYLDDVMGAFEKRELVIWNWYFSGRMDTISMKKKGNERKGC